MGMQSDACKGLAIIDLGIKYWYHNMERGLYRASAIPPLMSQIPTARHIPDTDQHSPVRADKLFGSSSSPRLVALKRCLYIIVWHLEWDFCVFNVPVIPPRKPRKPLLLLVPEPGHFCLSPRFTKERAGPGLREN